MPPSPRAERRRVWDPAIRLFHWLLAVLVIANWSLGQFGPDVMTLHFWLGYAILGLLVLRIVWGIIGPPEARFARFVRGPASVRQYLRGMWRREPSLWPGHTPLGALAVLAMLAALLVQVGTGLISDPDDFINVGPLAGAVGQPTARAAVGWHHLGGTVILVLVLLHLAAILFYRVWKREDLITPMITGWKWVRPRRRD